jgi:peptidoglycan lytic transglycosylase
VIRRQAASLCVLTFFAADALLIGAAALGPKVPVRSMQSIALIPRPAPSPPTTLPVPAEPPRKPPPPRANQIGVASWYGRRWQGRVTASGKRFDDRQLTAAHRTLPLNTRVRVTNLKTGRSVDVTITDRGPYVHGRVIDLSEAAAKKLGMVKKGLVPVQITTIAPPEEQAKVASLDVR